MIISSQKGFFKTKLKLNPTRLIVTSFFLLILLGSLLLTLPSASKAGVHTPYIDALFTATSATCVTGLVIYDTFKHWSLFGQIVIIFLIQIGGLGIITLATFFSVMLGKKIGLKGMMAAQESINNFTLQDISKLIKRIVPTAFIIEFIGAAILSTRLVPVFGGKGFYYSLFHAVSAFCNAGFDLMGALGKADFISLTPFNNDPVFLYTFAILIIIGGLGFIVWKDLFDYRKNKSLLLHTKLVLLVTAILIISGSLFFYGFENANPATMGSLDQWGKINASFFQAVTPRTAGFNSIDIGQMKDISKIMTVILMFIGAAPGSTGGGIKVTTFGVIILAIISQIRGYEEVTAFKRRIPTNVIFKALSIAGLSAFLVIIVTTLILATDQTKTFLQVLFETTSAFGTVGLSTGITPSLTNFSKILLTITMFLGRVGPVTFAIALTMKTDKKHADIIYPEGKIVVG